MHTSSLRPLPIRCEAAQCRLAPFLVWCCRRGTSWRPLTSSGSPLQVCLWVLALIEHYSSDSQKPSACHFHSRRDLACLLTSTTWDTLLGASDCDPVLLNRRSAPCSRERCCWVHALPAVAAPGSRTACLTPVLGPWVHALPAAAPPDSLNRRFCSAGHGGHGGTPQVVVDSVVAASAAVMNLQPLVSRETDPVQGAVVGVTRMNSGQGGRVVNRITVVQGCCRAWGRCLPCAVLCSLLQSAQEEVTFISSNHTHQSTLLVKLESWGQQERVLGKHACARCSLHRQPQLQRASIAPRRGSSHRKAPAVRPARLCIAELPSIRAAWRDSAHQHTRACQHTCWLPPCLISSSNLAQPAYRTGVCPAC